MTKKLRLTSVIALAAIAAISLILLISPTNVAKAGPGADWISFNGSPAASVPDVIVSGQDKSGMRVKFTLPGFENSVVSMDSEAWDKISFPGQGYLGEVGNPDLPVLRKFFAIPSTTGLQVRIINVDYEEFKNIMVPPLQPLAKETESPDDFPFEINDDLYESDEFYPSQWVSTRIAGIWHGVRMGQLEIRPFRFNPITGVLQVATKIDFVVEFVGNDALDALPYTSRIIPGHMSKSYRSALVNYDFMNFQSAERDAGIDYLIIVDDALASAQSLQDLVDYHTNAGRTVSVVSTTVTGTTANSVKAYIQAEYDSITPADLDYVLIVADVSVVPFKVDAFNGYDSDAWYSWLEGGDIFGDVGLGRFPAQDEAELDNMVAKTLNFHNKVSPGDWLDKSVLIANLEYYPSKYTECKQSIYDHTFSLDPPIMDKIFGGDPTQDPTNDDIMAAIEEGRGLVNYRGHGNDTSWTNWNLEGQYYTTSHVRTLLNGQMTPVVYSIACLNLNMMESSSETLGEAFIRYDQGAVAFLGAIHPSYTLPNHDFDRSLYYAPWDQGITPIGDVLLWANLDMYNTYCGGQDDCWGEDNITMYLWVGDPTIEIPVSGIIFPNDLTATALNTTEIELNWQDRSDNEDGFSIERQDEGTDAFVELTTVGPNVTTWTDNGLDECGTYTYRVRAYKITEYSIYSNEATTQTLGSSPSNLAAIGTAIDANTLTWTDNTTTESGFSIFRQDPGADAFVLIHITEMDVTTYVDTGLDEGTIYEYKIATTTLGGDSLQIGPVSSITLPVAPSTVNNTPHPDLSMTIDWTDDSVGEDGYRIYRAPFGTTTWSEVGSVGSGETTFDDDTTTEATEYIYAIAGYNGSGEGPYSASNYALTVPAPPSSLLATTVSTSQIHIEWVDNSSGETGYRIERDLGSGAGFEVLTSVHANGTTFSDTSLTEGILASYKIYGFNNSGDSVASGAVLMMTMPNAPSDLDGIKITSVTLTWIDNSATEEGYKIERRTGTGTFAQIGTVGIDNITFEDTAPPQGQVDYRVCAYNSYVDSEYTNTFTVEEQQDDDDDDDDDATTDDDDTVDDDDDDDATDDDDDDATDDDDNDATDDDDDDDNEGCGC